MLVYALGGGRGHAVRGSVLAAALRRCGAEARVLVPSSAVEVPALLGVPCVPCPRPRDAAALRRFVLDTCERHAVHVLLVDTFPEGLLGELCLGPAGPPRVGLLRCRRDAASESFLRGVRQLRLALDLEPHLGWLPRAVAAEALGPVTRPLAPTPSPVDVLVVASEPALVPTLRRLSLRLGEQGMRVALAAEGRLVAPGVDRPAFPLPPSFLGAKVVVGAAGFNLTYEAHTQGAWHVALPRARSHDDQRRRAAALGRTVDGPLALERLVARLVTGAGRAPRLVDVLPAEVVARRVLAVV
ncbi:MAG: hypothetical protein IT373_25735 [Polyangiaceae bacterium]|nr:hypothetical protein [Polyangiaceae bacterium]